ncbi:hypothetical protein L3X38_027067 [Prunus dulcis]|uniref:Uncharacterized protein n=1 Tax=Prunus dulcis TaxID=3755 RepID=A0AAD4VN42_PRUDU|nr:hypothetical protein L3X38_027067 [Prunus dulcis]
MDRQWIAKCCDRGNDPNYKKGIESFIDVVERKPLSFIDNWERLHKDREHNWISEDAQEKHMLATNMQSVQEDYSNLRTNLVAALEASNNDGLDNAWLMSMLHAALMSSATT